MTDAKSGNQAGHSRPKNIVLCSDGMPPMSLQDPLGWIAAAASVLCDLLGSADAMRQIAKKVAFTWWFVPGMLVCYGVAALVDRKLDGRFSSFWHPLRPRLHT